MRDKVVRKISDEPIIGIYLITNKINGKVYVGQSIDIERRWSQHRYGKGSLILKNAIKKYGIENFHFDIVETIKSIDKTVKENKLIILEQKWLDGKKSFLRENGYNIQEKAKPSIPIERDENFGELIRRIKIENNHCGKPVKQYSLDGIFLTEWKSSAEIERKLGFKSENISSSCLRKSKTSNNFIWRFSTDTLSDEEIRNVGIRTKPVNRKIKQLTLDGEIIKIWDSLKKLYKNSNFDHRPVKKCCVGERIEYKGCKWEFI